MLKEIQEELKSNSSAAEVPKEAGQSLTSRAAPPAAKPAPIVGEWVVYLFGVGVSSMCRLVPVGQALRRLLTHCSSPGARWWCQTENSGTAVPCNQRRLYGRWWHVSAYFVAFVCACARMVPLC
jgi:hypothetical protein